MAWPVVGSATNAVGNPRHSAGIPGLFVRIVICVAYDVWQNARISSLAISKSCVLRFVSCV